MTTAPSDALAEMGWNDSEHAGQFDRVASGALLLIVGGVYWGSLWLLSGLAPLVYLAARAHRNRLDCELARRHRRP